MAKLSLGQIDLGDFDRDWFIVMSRLGGKSIRSNASSVLGFYVRRRLNEYKEMLGYTARKHGLTEEECFALLLKDQELPAPIEGFSEMPPNIGD
jgi:hypothetical protein